MSIFLHFLSGVFGSQIFYAILTAIGAILDAINTAITGA